MAAQATITIRPYRPGDRGQVMALAPRVYAALGYQEEDVQLTKAIPPR